MRLVTYQTMEAFKQLIKNGYLVYDEKYMDIKYKVAYDWISKKMSEQIEKEDSIKYPIWAWKRYYNYISPPKRKEKGNKENLVKITFDIDDSEVFLTDFAKYSFILNGKYLPSNKKDYLKIEKEMKNKNITDEDLKEYVRRDKYINYRSESDYLNLLNKVIKSWDKIISDDSDIIQACIWKLKLNDIVKIEFCNEQDTIYNSVNYVRSNGKRPDWINDYIKKLK